MNKVEFKAEDLEQDKEKEYHSIPSISSSQYTEKNFKLFFDSETGKSKIPPTGRTLIASSESISNCEDLISLLEHSIESNNGFAKHEARRALNTIRSQLVTIQVLDKHLQDLADCVEDKMTYMCGCRNCIETVKSIIRNDVKPFENQCIHCGQCEGRREVSSE